MSELKMSNFFLLLFLLITYWPLQKYRCFWTPWKTCRTVSSKLARPRRTPHACNAPACRSALSTAMMPPGVPVATVAVGKAGAKNSAILAVQILATSDEDLAQKLHDYKNNMREEVLKKDKALNS